MEELALFIERLEPGVRELLIVQLQAELDGGWGEVPDRTGEFHPEATEAFNRISAALLPILRDESAA